MEGVLMIKGCYYRCPVAIEAGDSIYPRFFVMAQLIEYNELADAVKMKMHDLIGTKAYYRNILNRDVFKASSVCRCSAVKGGLVECAQGKGNILAKVNSTDKSLPYEYFIKLHSGEIIRENETNLKIEFSQMDFSPAEQLRNYEFQHPTWFINHLKVSRVLNLVNNASYGFDILSGCRAFLLPHQISTVSRCFESLPIRYMLADEVGLGKTVEACSIMKILLSENIGYKVLIIVPAALVTQWKNELYYKFNINATIAKKSNTVCILPLEDLLKYKELCDQSWDLAIVDETHRLLLNDSIYRCVQRISESVTHILLLSATPIQERNEEYRKLLALLSPEQYASMPAERFSWLVNKQQSIQQSVNQQLGRLSKYEDYSEIIVDKLQDISSSLNDKGLKKLIASIDLSTEDGGKEAVTQALSYICENYRVERKVIRNRRQLISEELADRELIELPYTPLTADEIYNETGAIQTVLSYLSDHSDDSDSYITEIAIPLLGALFSSPWALTEMIHSLKIRDDGLIDSALDWKRQAISEHNWMEKALDEDPDLIKGRLLTVLNYIDQETDITDSPEFKIVVFTSYNATLKEFLKIFNTRYKKIGIKAVAFGKGMSQASLEDSVYAFQNDPECRAIICDETGGEGRNFQNAQMVIHLDIPWNANAIEQRIGRLDRLGRDPNMVVTSVVVYTQNTVEEQLFHIWKDGMKLFEQSLSGLEIITGELNSLIIEALADDFYNGLSNAFDDILDEAEEMRESVEDEQLFDVGATLYRPLSQGIDNVLKLYSTENDNFFANAMLGWGGQAGLISDPITKDNLVRFREEKFEPRAAMQSLFAPIKWKRYANSSMVRRLNQILGTFDRKTASLREDLLFFAPGDTVYDSIISNAVGCSRGRCCAFEIKDEYEYDGILYIFNTEANVSYLLENGFSLRVLEQYKMFLPLNQIMILLPLKAASKSIPEDKVLDTVLHAKASQLYHLGRRSRDSKLSYSPLEEFIIQTPPDIWEPIIERYTRIAYKKAIAQIRDNTEFETARDEMQRVIHGMRSERIFFEKDDSDIKEKTELFNATLKAIKTAKPVLDAACVIRVIKNGK